MLRERLPEAVAALVPKGRKKCGNHEWYRSSETTWRCYHCAPGVTHELPWSAREIEARRTEAAAVLARAEREQPAAAPLTRS